MATLYKQVKTGFAVYFDRRTYATIEEHNAAIAVSATVYVGNISFYTREEQIYELFGDIATVKQVIVGLDRFSKTPCGFCFVEYYCHDDAQAAVYYLNGVKLDDRLIRVDMDPGFREGRQFGRGKSGGQMRDEYRKTFDPGRGGYGKGEAREASERGGGGDRRRGGRRERGYGGRDDGYRSRDGGYRGEKRSRDFDYYRDSKRSRY